MGMNIANLGINSKGTSGGGGGGGGRPLSRSKDVDKTSTINFFDPKHKAQQAKFQGKYDMSGFNEPLFSNNIINNIKILYNSIVYPIKPLAVPGYSN